ncbi:uncharacterized protein TRUGW13939_07703 [Talaromyces rugulosus]|uniref:DUF1479 domain protein n=1 Tax=Talaromyces rugulosus TaxID=121627 RepID=A0A7H8R3F2_TALRU|nr:uncharacterized protein TRUGW13939_07703 [Talaromyces rugulosus]QKX60558.1 hypothetical protein TRUGW13939_07703 [Talaromyces rugulosus]
MVGPLSTWPSWPEFTVDSEEREKSADLTTFKTDIINEYGQENLIKSWLKVCSKLEEITKEIREKGNKVIPEITFEDLDQLSEQKKEEYKTVGCFLIRGVVQKELAEKWFVDLKSYVADNEDMVTGWPPVTPSILRMYYSPVQMAARSHPNSLKVAGELINWWHDSENAKDQPPLEPLTYIDAVRIRPPGQPFFGLGPHIDAGSLSRWADTTYRACYAPVWQGNPEDLDLYELSLRKKAKTRLFAGSAHCSVFRAFQGWTSLTTTGPGEGSLLLYPHVKWVMAYILLRPFFKAPNSTKEEDIMDASKWTFDAETPWFPGTFRPDSQRLSVTSHPHLRLRDCLVHIPPMQPGDTVWWHADMCHAVDTEHKGAGDSSVLYIAATPSTEDNIQYIDSQRDAFLGDNAPPDFQAADRVYSPEAKYKGYQGQDAIVSPEGRNALRLGVNA